MERKLRDAAEGCRRSAVTGNSGNLAHHAVSARRFARYIMLHHENNKNTTLLSDAHSTAE